MSNSSRIEKATRQHVGQTLTSAQVIELVKVSEPDWKGGTYPSDAAYKRTPEGTLVPRGKTAYGDGVLEYLADNSFKVLPTEQIVRRPASKKKAVASAPATPVAEVKPTEEKKKAAASTSAKQPPVATKRLGAAGQAVRQ